MTKNFYDKVAKKFGDYQNSYKVIREFPNGDPEAIFKQKLLEVSGKNKIALDSGCADGVFTLSIAPHFQKIVAVDNSQGMLLAAKRYQLKSKVKNVEFVRRNIYKTDFPAGSFDVVYNRRGPDNFPLFYKILKHGGHYISVDIGEKDAQAIKEVFGRGQNFGEWNKSYLEKEIATLEKLGFEIIYSGDFFCSEYYLSRADLNLFLQGVPIFEDYDFEKDKRLFDEYVRKFKKEKGIELSRHRLVVVARKKA